MVHSYTKIKIKIPLTRARNSDPFTSLVNNQMAGLLSRTHPTHLAGCRWRCDIGGKQLRCWMRTPAISRVTLFWRSFTPCNYNYTDPSSGRTEEMQLLGCYSRKYNFLFLQIGVFPNSNLVVAMPQSLQQEETNQEEVRGIWLTLRTALPGLTPKS